MCECSKEILNMHCSISDMGYQKFVIGRVGETDYRSVSIDCSAWYKERPDADITFVCQRSDGESYPIVTSRDGNVHTWIPSDTDTQVPGLGLLQAYLTEGDTIGKSAIAQIFVADALSGHDPPIPVPDWVIQVIETGEAVQEAVEHYPYIDDDTGDWFVWDVQTEQFVDTGVHAQGPAGEITADAIEEALGYVPLGESDLDPVYGAIDAHIEDKSNPHEVDQDQVGLGNVDDTSDMDKPISSATQAALDQKLESTSYATLNTGGTVKVNPEYGIGIGTGQDDPGTLYVLTMDNNDIDDIWEGS